MKIKGLFDNGRGDSIVPIEGDWKPTQTEEKIIYSFINVGRAVASFFVIISIIFAPVLIVTHFYFLKTSLVWWLWILGLIACLIYIIPMLWIAIRNGLRYRLGKSGKNAFLVPGRALFGWYCTEFKRGRKAVELASLEDFFSEIVKDKNSMIKFLKEKLSFFNDSKNVDCKQRLSFYLCLFDAVTETSIIQPQFLCADKKIKGKKKVRPESLSRFLELLGSEYVYDSRSLSKEPIDFIDDGQRRADYDVHKELLKNEIFNMLKAN